MGRWYGSDGTSGGTGVVVRHTLNVTPGQQFPVVVGAAGAAGGNINVYQWNAACNGGTGGTSSFGDMAVVGGTGADQTSDGRNAIFTNTANAVAVGSIPGGAPTIVTAAGTLTAYSTAGGGGFVLVEW